MITRGDVRLCMHRPMHILHFSSCALSDSWRTAHNQKYNVIDHTSYCYSNRLAHQATQKLNTASVPKQLLEICVAQAGRRRLGLPCLTPALRLPIRSLLDLWRRCAQAPMLMAGLRTAIHGGAAAAAAAAMAAVTAASATPAPASAAVAVACKQRTHVLLRRRRRARQGTVPSCNDVKLATALCHARRLHACTPS